MKPNCLKTISLLLCFIALSSMVFAQMPAAKGEGKVDEAALRRAQAEAEGEAWVKAHPEEYRGGKATVPQAGSHPTLPQVTPLPLMTGAGQFKPAPATTQAGPKIPVSKPDSEQPSNSAQGESAAVPSDFPQWVDTGHPENDALAYQQKKSIWIAQHPDAYEKFKRAGTQGKHEISMEEFSKMPKEKQEMIQNQPDKYTIIAK